MPRILYFQNANRLSSVITLKKKKKKFTAVLSQWDFSHVKLGLLSRATQPTVHAGCFSVSIIHPTLTWTTGSLMCTQMLMHAVAHGSVRKP